MPRPDQFSFLFCHQPTKMPPVECVLGVSSLPVTTHMRFGTNAYVGGLEVCRSFLHFGSDEQNHIDVALSCTMVDSALQHFWRGLNRQCCTDRGWFCWRQHHPCSGASTILGRQHHWRVDNSGASTPSMLWLSCSCTPTIVYQAGCFCWHCFCLGEPHKEFVCWACFHLNR